MLSQAALEQENHSWLQRHADAVFHFGDSGFFSDFFVNLGSGVLQTADEQTYSQWAYHMFKTGDYLTPWACGAVSFMIGKPPFLMWLMSLGYQVFGVTNFAVRIWSAGFGALSLVLVFYLGRNSTTAPSDYVSACLRHLLNLLHFCKVRHDRRPVDLLHFGKHLLLCFKRRKRKLFRYAVLGGLFFGLALMTKQIAALLIPLIIFAYLACDQESLRFLFTKSFHAFLGRWGSAFFALADLHGGPFRESVLAVVLHLRRRHPVSWLLEGHFAGYLFYFNYLLHNENWLWLALCPSPWTLRVRRLCETQKRGHAGFSVDGNRAVGVQCWRKQKFTGTSCLFSRPSPLPSQPFCT